MKGINVTFFQLEIRHLPEHTLSFFSYFKILYCFFIIINAAGDCNCYLQ